MGVGALGHQPRPELGKRPSLVGRRQRRPGGEAAIDDVSSGIGVVREQGAPQIRAVLSEALHVDVHLDVGSGHGRLLDSTDEWNVGEPRNRADDRVVEALVGGPVCGRVAVVAGELIDRRDPDRAQCVALVAVGDEADISTFLQLRAAAPPPRTPATLTDPTRRRRDISRRDVLPAIEDLAIFGKRRPDPVHDDAVGVESDDPCAQLVFFDVGREPLVEEHLRQVCQS